MIIILNGPLGIGKSTLAEALTENINGCSMLDCDRLIAVNPPFHDTYEFLHSTIALLVEHQKHYGYIHFVIDYIWANSQLSDLKHRLAHIDDDFHCFLLTLPIEENIKRIKLRSSTSAINDLEVELDTFKREHEILNEQEINVGEEFDVSAPPNELFHTLLHHIGRF